MELIIDERGENTLFFSNKSAYFYVQDYSELENINDLKNMVKYLVFNDQFFNLLEISDEEKRIICRYCTKEINNRELKYSLFEDGMSLITITMISNQIDKYYCKYNKLINKGIDNITITCNKDNFLKALSLGETIIDKEVIVKSKDISICDFYELLEKVDREKYDKLNIKIDSIDSSELLSLSTLFKVCNKVKETADKISNLNLSNIEKVMYTYDVVKERVYKECHSNLSQSRDIDKVVFGNHIVCVGYARLMKSLLSFYGIKAKVIISEKEEHAMCLVYIKDEKYNIDGFLVFDPTSDSRRSKNDNEYIDNYRYFAIPVSVLNKSIPVEELMKINVSFDHLLYDLVGNNNYDNIIIRDNISSLFKLMNDDFDFKINDIDEKEKKKNEYDIFRKRLFKTSICLNDFIAILYNVRRNEYYNGDIDRFDIEDIREASIKWINSIKNISECKKSSFINIFDYVNYHSYLEDNDNELISLSLNRSVSVKEDMLDIKLLKILRKRLDKKGNNI